MTGAERVAEHELSRMAIERAARAEDGSPVVPGDAGRLVIDVVLMLARGQHTPLPEGIWPAIERALEAGAAIRGDRGEVRFVRAKDKGEYGVEIQVREVR